MRCASEGSLSLNWEINGERLSVLAWPRAILLQFAHPLIAEAVARHSTFERNRLAPFRRLHATIAAMRAIAFGPADARDRAIARIRAIHRNVHGTLPDAVGAFGRGTPYSAEDPELLLWVHATLLDSVPRFHAAVVRPLVRTELDAFCAESAPLAEALGVDPGRVPRSQSDLEAYLAASWSSGRLVVGATARALAARVLTPPFQVVLFPASWMQRQLTVASLPAQVRQQYGFALTAGQARAARWLEAWLRQVRRVTPDALARFPEARERRAGLR